MDAVTRKSFMLARIDDSCTREVAEVLSSTVHLLLTEVRLQCTELPVVLLSRLGVHFSNWTCATTGADAFFLMPVNEDELRKFRQKFAEEGSTSLRSESIDKLIQLTEVAGDTFFEKFIRLFIEENPKSLEYPRVRSALLKVLEGHKSGRAPHVG